MMLYPEYSLGYQPSTDKNVLPKHRSLSWDCWSPTLKAGSVHFAKSGICGGLDFHDHCKQNEYGAMIGGRMKKNVVVFAVAQPPNSQGEDNILNVTQDTFFTWISNLVPAGVLFDQERLVTEN